MEWLRATAAAVVLAAAAATDARAAVTYVSQDRRVEADTGQLGEGGVPDFGTDRLRTQSAPDFGPFNGEVESTFTATDGDVQRARVTQSSRLNNNGMTASGVIDTSSADEAVRYRSLFDVTFDVDRASTWSLASSVAFTNTSSLLSLNSEPDVTLRLTRVDAAGGEDLVNESRFLISQGNPTDFSFSDDGALSQGRYRLLFDLGDAHAAGGLDGTYDLNLGVSASSNGGGPNPIPLPPAFWVGMMTMGGAGAVRFLRRRFRAAE